MTQVNKTTLKESPNKSITYQELEKRLRDSLYDQEKAVTLVTDYLSMFFARLNDPTKPIGSFMFTGPTGTGKTEFARVLAEVLGFDLLTINMSEFAQEHTIHGLIGAPPSYVGYNQPTILEQLKGKRTVLLLDEVEKAHPDIHKLFLSAMDKASVTLSNNTVVSFSNCIIIMTSNAGVVTAKGLGLGETREVLSVNMEELKNYFPPEFMGRLNGVIEFKKLETSTVLKIVDKFVEEFNLKLNSVHNAHLELSEKAKLHLIDIGYSSFYGARTIKNALNQHIFLKVAKHICDMPNIDVLSVDYANEFKFSLSHKEHQPESVPYEAFEKMLDDNLKEEVAAVAESINPREYTEAKPKNRPQAKIGLYLVDNSVILSPSNIEGDFKEDFNEYVSTHKFKSINPGRWYLPKKDFTEFTYRELAFMTDRQGVKIGCDQKNMDELQMQWAVDVDLPQVANVFFQPFVDSFYRNRDRLELALIILTVVGILNLFK